MINSMNNSYITPLPRDCEEIIVDYLSIPTMSVLSKIKEEYLPKTLPDLRIIAKQKFEDNKTWALAWEMFGQIGDCPDVREEGIRELVKGHYCQVYHYPFEREKLEGNLNLNLSETKMDKIHAFPFDLYHAMEVHISENKEQFKKSIKKVIEHGASHFIGLFADAGIFNSLDQASVKEIRAVSPGFITSFLKDASRYTNLLGSMPWYCLKALANAGLVTFSDDHIKLAEKVPHIAAFMIEHRALTSALPLPSTVQSEQKERSIKPNNSAKSDQKEKVNDVKSNSISTHAKKQKAKKKKAQAKDVSFIDLT